MPDTSSDIRSRLQETQTLIQQGQRNEAIALLNKTINTPLTLAPDLFWAGLLAHDLQIPQAAAYLINEAIKLDPKVPDYHTHYGRVLTALQQYTLAEEALKKAIQMDPTPAMYYYHLGALYYASGDFQNAKTALRHTLNRDQQHIDTWASLARIALLESDYTAMRQHLQNALAFAPRHPQLLYLWGLLLKQENDPGSALGVFKEVLQSVPHYYDAWYEYGMLLQQNAAYEEALSAFTQANHYHNPEPVSEQVKQADQQLFDDTCRFIHALQEIPPVTATHLPQHLAPVYITGFPRSGSSLLSSMLEQHPELHAAGELTSLNDLGMLAKQQLTEEYDKQHIFEALWKNGNETVAQLLADSYKALLCELQEQHAIPAGVRIIDKSPFNVRNFPLIARIAPHSHIINIIRDGREASWSCFTQCFSEHLWFTHSPVDGVRQWAKNIRHARSYARLFNLNYYELHYEHLVRDPEKALRKLLDFLELDWNNACLMHRSTARPVLTASYDQVKQAVYRSPSTQAAHYPGVYTAMTEAARDMLQALHYLDEG